MVDQQPTVFGFEPPHEAARAILGIDGARHAVRPVVDVKLQLRVAFVGVELQRVTAQDLDTLLADLNEALDPARMTKPDAGMVGAGGG